MNCKNVLLLFLIIVILCFCVGCTAEEIDPYKGKQCILCDAPAKCKIVGTPAYCFTLNPHYTSNHCSKNAGPAINIFFCSSCHHKTNDKHPVAGDYSDL